MYFVSWFTLLFFSKRTSLYIMWNTISWNDSLPNSFLRRPDLRGEVSVRGCRLTRLHNERCAGAPPWPCRFTTTNRAWETQGQLVGRNEENAANNQTWHRDTYGNAWRSWSIMFVGGGLGFFMNRLPILPISWAKSWRQEMMILRRMKWMTKQDKTRQNRLVIQKVKFTPFLLNSKFKTLFKIKRNFPDTPILNALI